MSMPQVPILSDRGKVGAKTVQNEGGELVLARHDFDAALLPGAALIVDKRCTLPPRRGTEREP